MLLYGTKCEHRKEEVESLDELNISALQLIAKDCLRLIDNARRLVYYSFSSAAEE